MRLTPVLDFYYTLGSLWGAVTGPQVCPSGTPAFPRAVAVGTAGLPTPAGVTAFVDVNVVPMDTERVLAHHTVLVQDGRITALGPTAKVRVPAGAVRVDGRGQYLMPGLGVMHDHRIRLEGRVSLAEDGTIRGTPYLTTKLAIYLASGITSTGIGSDNVTPDVPVAQLPLVRRFLETLPGPRAYLPRSVQHGVQKGIPWSDSLAASLAAAKANGYDHIFVPQRAASALERGGVRDSLLAVARQVGLPVTIHAHGAPLELTKALGVGAAIEHIYNVEAGLPRGRSDSQWTEMQIREMETRARAIQQAGTWIAPTLYCKLQVDSLSPGLRIVKMLHDSGARLLLALDDEWQAYDELVGFVRAGLTPYQALVTGTRNIAEYFGQLAERGTVTVGKQADLVLLSGNPLADIRHTLEPAGVMIRGRWLDRAALDQQLLAVPKEWIGQILQQHRGGTSGIMFGLDSVSVRTMALRALGDSLTEAKSNKAKAEYERLVGQIAAGFGALRAVLAPGQQREWLDPHARVWMREQARQGYRVATPGVTLTP